MLMNEFVLIKINKSGKLFLLTTTSKLLLKQVGSKGKFINEFNDNLIIIMSDLVFEGWLKSIKPP